LKNLSLKNVGMGLGLIGGLALVFATFFDTAPEGTHNIGLMQVQMLWALFAALCLLISAILIVGNHLGEKLDRRVELPQP
jgi:hypothetical protein